MFKHPLLLLVLHVTYLIPELGSNLKDQASYVQELNVHVDFASFSTVDSKYDCEFLILQKYCSAQ